MNSRMKHWSCKSLLDSKKMIQCQKLSKYRETASVYPYQSTK